MDFRAHIVEVVSDSILPMSGKMEITRRVARWYPKRNSIRKRSQFLLPITVFQALAPR